MKDAIEAGLVWMRTYWAEIKQALPGPAQHLPTATDFDLILDVPGSAIEVGRAGGATPLEAVETS